MTFLAHLADRVLNRPILITPEKAEVILSVLGGRIGVDAPAPKADRFEGDQYERDGEGHVVRDAWGDPVKARYALVGGHVATVPIVGSLVNRGAWIGASSGLVSYEGIKRQLKDIGGDDRVDSVILDIQSPGGEAIGAFEAADMVRQIAASKRVVAVVNGMAASAAYAIASGASEIVTTETGVSGSIGVVLLHVDYSRWLEKEGVAPTLIFAGSHKVDANPFEPLPKDVRADLQSEVDALYSAFLATVAKGRGQRLTEEMARATQARTFIGEAAVKVGMADRVGTFETVLDELSGAQGGRIIVPGRSSQMDRATGAPAADRSAGISQAEHDAAVETSFSEGEAAGNRAGAEAERKRFAAVLTAEGIAGNAVRMAHAAELAADAPEMSADRIVALTTKHVPATTSSASLANRQADQDPIGAAAGGEQKQKSGLARHIDAHIAAVKPS